MAALDRSGRRRPRCRRVHRIHDARSGRPAVGAERLRGAADRPGSRPRATASLRRPRRTAWRRPGSGLDPVLDRAGALSGQRLVLGLDGERVTRTLDPRRRRRSRPARSGRVVLVGSDDGATSRVQADRRRARLRLADRRRARRHPPRDDRSGGLVHLRDARRSRQPRRPRHLATPRSMAQRRPRQVLGPPPPDARFGRTFSTEFTWDVAGDRLAVQSCAEVACRIRVITPGGGPTVTLDSPDLGPIVGLDGDLAVTYEACRGLPCPIVSTDLWTGDRRVLAPAAGLAVVVPTADGARLVHESRRRERATAAVRRARRRWRRSTSGRSPTTFGSIRRPSAPSAATSLPAGWVLLAPRRPPPGRRQHRPPAAPPRPGRLDRPAR